MQADTILHHQTISDADAEALLYDLVSVPSPSYHEADAAQMLVTWMQGHGYDRAFVDEAGNAVGIVGQGTREVMLLGHIDTFGGNPPLRLDGRRLYGRGAVDAKGSLCAFAVAAARARLGPDVRLVVVGAVEEEAPTSKGAHFIGERYRPHLCIVGEPSGWERITLGYKGRLVLEWAWRGGLAHSAGQAPTPAERAVAYWTRVQAHAADLNAGNTRLFDRLDTTLQDLNSDSDGVYGWARMTVGLRLPPGVDPALLAADLQPDDGATITVGGMEAAFVGEKDTHLSRALRGAIRAEGGTPAFVFKTGTSDMNVVGPLWGCPIAAYGPGDSALDHTPGEHIDLDEYQRAIRVLTSALERI